MHEVVAEDWTKRLAAVTVHGTSYGRGTRIGAIGPSFTSELRGQII